MACVAKGARTLHVKWAASAARLAQHRSGAHSHSAFLNSITACDVAARMGAHRALVSTLISRPHTTLCSWYSVYDFCD